jgi:hypothetical protein
MEVYGCRELGRTRVREASPARSRATMDTQRSLARSRFEFRRGRVEVMRRAPVTPCPMQTGRRKFAARLPRRRQRLHAPPRHELGSRCVLMHVSRGRF